MKTLLAILALCSVAYGQGLTPSATYCDPSVPMYVYNGDAYICKSGVPAKIAAGNISGTTNNIPKFTSATGVGNSALTDNGTTLTSTEPFSNCIGSPCLTFTATSPIENVNLNWSNGYLGLLESLNGQIEVNGSVVNTDSLPANFVDTFTPDSGYTACKAVKVGATFGCENLTPASASSFMPAFGNGMIEWTMPGTGSAMTGVGSTFTVSGTGTNIGVSATAPNMLNAASTAVSGNPSGYNGGQNAWGAGLPTYMGQVNFSASSDYSASRVWIGLVHAGATGTLNCDGAGTLCTVTAVSGGSGFSGSGTIFLTAFNNGCTGSTVTVTLASGVFSSAATTASGTGCTSAPTSATCTSGTATCTGSPVSITVTSTLSTAFNMAAIRYSTIAGDATACSSAPCYQCVTGNGTAQTVTAMTGAAPGTTATTMEIDINASNVVCHVGATTATNTTTLPSSAAGYAWWELNITQSAAAVNIRTNGWLGKYQASGGRLF